jgi:pimeloyl-ACP methyl ester carboxylesterase
VAVAAAAEVPVANGLEWGECPFEVAEGVRCGKLAVPEDWSRPEESRTISVGFAVIPAGIPAEKAEDPIAFLTGGPGFSAFAMMDLYSRMAVNRSRDVIVMEPRGYGYSDPALLCGAVDQFAECHAKYTGDGIDLNQYTTEASVRDYEALRSALGYDTWNILGVSYGTYWASHYQRMFPGSLRSVIMDSPYPPHAGYDWNREGALNAFELMFNDCRANTLCNAAYPDLRNRFIETLRRIEADGITLGETTLDFPSFFRMIYGSIYYSPSLHRTPLIIDAAARGDDELLLQIASAPPILPPAGFDPARLSAMGLNASVMCAEDIFFPAAAETRTALTAPWPEDIFRMITPEGWDYDRRCAAWPVERTDPVLNEPVTTDVPTIVLVGAYDPICPPDMAEAMLLTMSNGTLVLDPSTAHGLFAGPNPCVQDIMVRFVDSPEDYVDVSCLSETPRVNWLLPHQWPERN